MRRICMNENFFDEDYERGAETSNYYIILIIDGQN